VFDEASLPHGEAAFPATLVMQLAVKVKDSPFLRCSSTA
jgi:hypothetical protein